MAARHTEHEKQYALCLNQNGASIKDISSRCSIPKSTIYYWINQYSEVKSSNQTSVTAQQIYLLEKRIKRLTTELEIWKRCGCTLDSPLKEKLSAIETLYTEEVYHHYYATIEDMESSIAEYIDFFNDRRPHQKLSYKTPNQVENEYFKAKK